MIPGAKLKEYRKQRQVSLQELAAELGIAAASTIMRWENRDLSAARFYEAVAAVEKIVERRKASINPLDALQGDAA